MKEEAKELFLGRSWSGGGRAPGGECETAFLGSAGSLRCKEIRGLRKLTCLGCVETAAECLARVKA